MALPSEEEKRRNEEKVRELRAAEDGNRPARTGGEARDPDTGALGTTNPRAAAPMGSSGPTGVVPPEREGGSTQWGRLALVVGAVIAIILVLILIF